MTNLAVDKTYAEEVADSLGSGPLTPCDIEICRLALREYDLGIFSWRRRYGRLALGLFAGLAIGALATIGVERAHAAGLHCQRTATGETVCDNGVRVTPTATGTKIERPGERPVRCARTPTGVSCNDR